MFLALRNLTTTSESSPLQHSDYGQEMKVSIYSVKMDALTDDVGNIFRLVNYSVLSSLIGMFGICSNIINMIVFHKQGFATTANISFFALALSDFLCLLTLEWCAICMNPYMESDAVPFVPLDLPYLTGGWCHVCFGRITSWVTVYITAERCLSVALPLKVKQMVSPRKTTFFMCAIFAINLIPVVPNHFIAYLDWKFVPERNKTLYGLVFRHVNSVFSGLVYTLTSVSGMFSFVAVIMLTTFLAIKLVQKSNWQSTATAKNENSEARTLRDKRTIKMIVMIATILIACYTPGSIISLVTLLEPEFILVGKYKNSYFAVWSFAFVCNTINSSVNMLLYYTMSTKYRETFNQLFAKCRNCRLCLTRNIGTEFIHP